MDSVTLQAAMPGLDLDRARRLVAGANQALRLIGADTAHLRRAQHFLAQMGHESVSLRYTEEIADGSAYNGRADLGNTQAGDGPRFKGRSFVQITGRHNYGLFSRWAFEQKLVTTPTHFLEHPDQVAGDLYAWVGATWYWLTQRPLNQLADADDLEGVTRAINGGLNGLDDRRQRLNHIRTLGTRILPSPVTAPPAPPDDDLYRAVRVAGATYVTTAGMTAKRVSPGEWAALTKAGLIAGSIVELTAPELALVNATAKGVNE